MAKPKNNAIESVRKLLTDNKKALEVLDVLENKNRQYQNTKRHTHIMYLIAATTLLISLYFAHRMYKSNCEMGIWLSIIVATIGTACIAGIPNTILDIDTIRMMESIEFDFINNLLSGYATYEIFPLIKAGNHYYIDLPDGIREVSMENVLCDENTQMIGREYRYKKLRWNSHGFFLQETMDVKICSDEESRRQERR